MKRFLKLAALVTIAFLVVIFFVGRKSYDVSPKSPVNKAAYYSPETKDQLRSLANVDSEAPTSAKENQATSLRKIIQTGDVTISVKHYDPFYKHLQNELQQVGGYISNLEANRDSGNVISARIVIRIPPAHTNLMVSWLREQGEIQSENIKAEDISEEYYDLNARLENAKRLEIRLLDMVNKNTGKLEDLILLEEKLGEVRERIEQMEGRIRNMDRLVSLATLSLNVQVQSTSTAATPTFFSRAARAWKHSVNDSKESFQGLLILLITIVPWILPLTFMGAILMLVYKMIRRVILKFTTKTQRTI